MRGKKQAQRQFVALIDVNARIPQGHPLREVKRLSDEVFGRLNPREAKLCYTGHAVMENRHGFSSQL